MIITTDRNCSHCPRLVELRSQVRTDYPEYHAAPVSAFGVPDADFIVVGLAPGMHGANATGRPFTGDYAGGLLYETLYNHGFASRAVSRSSDDGLQLYNCCITNAVKCLPPANKPVAAEVNNCNGFLARELVGRQVILALGTIAHRAIIRALALRQAQWPFGHAAEHHLDDGRIVLDSYHCSRYNTQTKRLTTAMFEQVFARARALVDR